MRKRLVALAVGGVAVVAAATAGIASADAGGDPFLEVKDTSVQAGDTVKLYGTCAYDPAPSVLSDAFTGGKGDVPDDKPFNGTAKIADVAAGEYEVVLHCDGEDVGVKPVVITVG
ncbi:MAG: hypothetical protein ACRDXX_20345 [Stackebrandtia sp.]